MSSITWFIILYSRKRWKNLNFWIVHICWSPCMDRGACQATVHSVTQSQTQMKQFSMHAHTHAKFSHCLSNSYPSWGRSVCQFRRSVMSDSLWSHGLQPTRFLCFSITNSWSLLKLMSIESVMPSNHLILFHPLLLLPSIFPELGSFPMSQFFALSGQSIGASASASVLSMNIQDWFPLGLTGLISLQSKGLSRVFSK